jgi:rhodanese-related sulfurtransferase
MKFIIDNWMLFVVAIGSGSMLLWPTLKGGMLNGGALSPNAAVQLINREKAVIVDVSEADEFATGHVGGAKNVPVSEIDSRLASVVKNKTLPLILVCPTGARAARVETMAKKLGYEKAQALAGGLKAWKEANLPLEKA